MKKKKIALLGDSIRLIGYGTALPQILGDGFEVWQPEDNCRFSFYLLRTVFDCSADLEGSDIIHFNCGLWDENDLFGDGSFTPVEDYVKSVCRIADILSKKCKKLIFATTTPVRPENEHNDNGRIRKYNEAVVPELTKRDIAINDLNALISKDIEKYIRADDLIHLTGDGIAAAAEQTAEIIKAEAAKIG